MSTQSREIPQGREPENKKVEQQPNLEISQHSAQQEQQVEQIREKEQPLNVEQSTSTVEDAMNSMRRAFGIKKKNAKGKIPQVRNEMTVQIEKIMEDGLKEAFQELTPVQAQEFKIKGEETAIKIQQLLKSTHVKVKKVFQLLFEWLKLLPGVNRFFLEQEAKIKTDKIIALHKMNKKQ